MDPYQGREVAVSKGVFNTALDQRESKLSRIAGIKRRR